MSGEFETRDDSNPGATRGLRVLVVDADAGVRESLPSVLARSGWQIEASADGFSALASMASVHPDIIFADVTSPRLDGYQTCALIKSNPDLRQTPVVLVCDEASGMDGARGRLVGSDDRMTRPYSADKVAALVRRHLSLPDDRASSDPVSPVEPSQR